MISRIQGRTLAVASVTALSAVALVGCSQIGALKQVSGVPITTLQIATNDVLVSQKIAVKEAPICVADATGTGYECKGTTVAGLPITVIAPEALTVSMTPTVGGSPSAMPNGALKIPMTVSVGGKVIFTGDAQQVIEKNQKGS